MLVNLGNRQELNTGKTPLGKAERCSPEASLAGSGIGTTAGIGGGLDGRPGARACDRQLSPDAQSVGTLCCNSNQRTRELELLHLSAIMH